MPVSPSASPSADAPADAPSEDDDAPSASPTSASVAPTAAPSADAPPADAPSEEDGTPSAAPTASPTGGMQLVAVTTFSAVELSALADSAAQQRLVAAVEASLSGEMRAKIVARQVEMNSGSGWTTLVRHLQTSGRRGSALATGSARVTLTLHATASDATATKTAMTDEMHASESAMIDSAAAALGMTDASAVQVTVEVFVVTAAPTAAPAVPTQGPTEFGETDAAPEDPPSAAPSAAPTGEPTTAPSAGPGAPSTAPTTTSPSTAPSAVPTPDAEGAPEEDPPSVAPTAAPTGPPTAAPTSPPAAPSAAPTASPAVPSTAPTAAPGGPTSQPSVSPTAPTAVPSAAPTGAPSVAPTATPSGPPSKGPTAAPTTEPTAAPMTSAPSVAPTSAPAVPSTAPTAAPGKPSAAPSSQPTTAPSMAPSTAPTAIPSVASAPTAAPTASPTTAPTAAPTASPTTAPSAAPTAPTAAPSQGPTAAPLEPTSQPSATPAAPTSAPTAPTATPSRAPTTPTVAPSAAPTAPTATPTAPPGPTAAPSAAVGPSAAPSAGPSAAPAVPTAAPTAAPSTPPTSPSAAPTGGSQISAVTSFSGVDVGSLADPAAQQQFSAAVEASLSADMQARVVGRQVEVNTGSGWTVPARRLHASGRRGGGLQTGSARVTLTMQVTASEATAVQTAVGDKLQASQAAIATAAAAALGMPDASAIQVATEVVLLTSAPSAAPSAPGATPHPSASPTASTTPPSRAPSSDQSLAVEDRSSGVDVWVLGIAAAGALLIGGGGVAAVCFFCCRPKAVHDRDVEVPGTGGEIDRMAEAVRRPVLTACVFNTATPGEAAAAAGPPEQEPEPDDGGSDTVSEGSSGGTAATPRLQFSPAPSPRGSEANRRRGTAFSALSDSALQREPATVLPEPPANVADPPVDAACQTDLSVRLEDDPRGPALLAPAPSPDSRAGHVDPTLGFMEAAAGGESVRSSMLQHVYSPQMLPLAEPAESPLLTLQQMSERRRRSSAGSTRSRHRSPGAMEPERGGDSGRSDDDTVQWASPRREHGGVASDADVTETQLRAWRAAFTSERGRQPKKKDLRSDPAAHRLYRLRKQQKQQDAARRAGASGQESEISRADAFAALRARQAARTLFVRSEGRRMTPDDLESADPHLSRLVSRAEASRHLREWNRAKRHRRAQQAAGTAGEESETDEQMDAVTCILQLTRRATADDVEPDDFSPYMITMLLDELCVLRTKHRNEFGVRLTPKLLRDRNPGMFRLYRTAHSSKYYKPARDRVDAVTFHQPPPPPPDASLAQGNPLDILSRLPVPAMPSSPPSITVHGRDLRQPVSVRWHAGLTAGGVKDAVEEAEGIPAVSQVITYIDRRISSVRQLSHAGVRPGSTLHMSIADQDA
eukprot:TRINITY_DN2773_c0_g1_i1.p1 TRINITY_DN2773_c0_g1~~TRINITY_DN2773_c0_g1_i1.p1  ORF type:complete len:1423 (+),score=299.20 TRINITY_DN2773_c0_g1_i1:101-4270(+)